MNPTEQAKKRAGYAAADLVQDGMIVGLGTGSTVFFAMERLSERIRQGLTILGIPTSAQASLRARAYGIPLTTLDDHPEIDIAIDGADQVDAALRLIKGRGAAHTRERVVAGAARELVIVIDPGKRTDVLSAAVPVEVLPFAATPVIRRLEAMGAATAIREGVKKDGPVVTDNSGWIIDCDFGTITDPQSLETTINNIPGVVCCGIFSEFTGKTKVIMGDAGGIRMFSS